MKKFGIMIFLAALVGGLIVTNIFSFGRTAGSFLNFSFNGGVKGSGTIETETRELTKFTGVDVGGVYQVEIVRGNIFSVEIRADDNILPLVRTEVKGSTLTIDSERKFKASETVRVKVTAPGIEQLETSGASSVAIIDFKNSELAVNASGASKISIDGAADKLKVEMSGASKLDSEALTVKDAELDVSGASAATVAVSGTLRADASGASKVMYVGEPTNLVKSSTGASRIEKK